AERPDLGALETTARDREVLHGPLGLGSVQRVDGHLHFAHRVVFDPVFLFSHEASLAQHEDARPVCCATSNALGTRAQGSGGTSVSSSASPRSPSKSMDE